MIKCGHLNSLQYSRQLDMQVTTEGYLTKQKANFSQLIFTMFLFFCFMFCLF